MARQGYWRSSNTSTLFHKCVREASCNGFQPGDVIVIAGLNVSTNPSLAVGRRLSITTAAEDCDVGYSGPLCSACVPGLCLCTVACAVLG